MTEAEAKTKWCPQIALQPRTDNTDDRIAYLNNRCIGPACMAWRYNIYPSDGMAGEGYCGLAGEP